MGPQSARRTPTPVRPNYPEPATFARGFGPLSASQPQPGVGEIAQRLTFEYLGRTVSDAEILDHIEHCTHLMELAHDRGEHAEVQCWRAQRADALLALSPAAKAEIEEQIDAGVGYFQSDNALQLGRLTR